MARPIKKGLDYFPLDVNLEEDVELLEAERGIVGFAILVKLWQKMYSSSYYINWDEDNLLLFAKRINTDINLINDVINTCFDRNLLDKDIYLKYKVLTSHGVQVRYIKACSDAKRKAIVFIKEYSLIEKYEEEYELITELTELTPEFSTQRKEEEKKEEKVDIYQLIFNYYIEQGIINHKAITGDMKKAIDRAKKELGLDLDYFERIIDRHKEKVELTKNNGKYAVKKRPLAELFGQKKKDSVSLICSDYLDEIYVKPKSNNNQEGGFAALDLGGSDDN